MALDNSTVASLSGTAPESVFKIPEGLPLSVFNTKYSRKKEDGSWQTWEERVEEVVLGNFGVLPDVSDKLTPRQLPLYLSGEGPEADKDMTLDLAKRGVLPFSGRHLQHGQIGQQNRSGEYLTNCSSSMNSFVLFYLLLKNSGVGRCYDSDICFVNWDYMPNVRLVLSAPDNTGNSGHPDYEPWIESLEDAQHKYGSENSEHIRWFTVEDSIEGWSQIVLILETAAFHRNNKDHLFIFDFSQVRARGAPVKGQQNRPASGPVPLIKSLMDVINVKGAGMPPWKQALFIDHFLASCVLLGGIRRSARMATKSWRDRDIIDFIDIKRGGKLYTANNSIAVDAEFWEQARNPQPSHGRRVFEAATAAAYFDQTGEPGFINLDLLHFNREGIEKITPENYLVNHDQSSPLSLKHPKTKQMISYMLNLAKNKKYPYIVNPCVTADTWVTTAKGARRVRDLIGKQFTAVVNGKKFKSTSEGFFFTGNKKVFKLTTVGGHTLKLTDDHKIQVIKEKGQRDYPDLLEWRKLKHLNPGDEIVLHDHQDLTWGGEGNFDEGYLMGLLIGDGTFYPNGKARLDIWRREEEIESCSIKKKVLKIHRKFGDDAYWREPYKKKDFYRISLESKLVNSLCQKFEVYRGNKTITSKMERASSDFYRGLLQGLFDTDGTIYGDPKDRGTSIRLAQKNLPLLKRVQRMLQRLGINSVIYKRKTSKYIYTDNGKGGKSLYNNKGPLYEVHIRAGASTLTFARRIGFLKADKAKRLAKNLTARVRKPNKNRFVTKIKKIEPIGKEKVYDCTVPGAHCFDANGIMAHNCSEIVLSVWGGYCVIGDIAMFYANNEWDLKNAATQITRFLIRANLQNYLYSGEVQRTNRIGVGLTGIFEYAYDKYGLTFHDLISYHDEMDSENKVLKFWKLIQELRKEVESSAASYISYLKEWYGIEVPLPHSYTCIKPSGTISKIMGPLTEGAHLPAYGYYLRWIQENLNNKEVLEKHRNLGYPIRDISHQYPDTAIIGFPTSIPIAKLMGDKLVTMEDVTWEEQITWLKLLERFWIGPQGNQVSYTLKYDPNKVSFEKFRDLLLEYQPQIRCCAIMPQADTSAYAYLPEEKITEQQYLEYISQITEFSAMKEYIDAELECPNEVCPIEMDLN